MVTWALGKSFCTAMAMMWEVVWRIFLRFSDSLVRGKAMVSGETGGLAMDNAYKKCSNEGI
jgi:hypothetical protein